MKRYHWVAFAPFYLLVVIVVIAVAYGGSQTVSVIKQNAPVEFHHTVIIDAGHGGIDGGATSCTGVLESRINLEIAVKLNDLLRLLGYQTHMIRTTDTSVYTQGQTIAAQKASDLKERARIVNETENSLLISIHQNTFSDSKYDGAQVFYASGGKSKELADLVQSAFTSTINPDSKRHSKKASGIYLMENIQSDGILVECGFLSNPTEEAKLRSKGYQQKVCCIIAASLSSFLGQNENIS